jgi:tetratricopeptide (TPR) repeat protein
MRKIKYFLPMLICLFSVSLVFSQGNNTSLGKGILYLNSNNIEKAIKYFNGLINQGESSSMLYFYLGEAYQEKGDLKNAITNYNQAIQLDSGNASAYYNLGLIEMMEGHQNKAIQNFNSVINAQPNSILSEMANKQIASVNDTSNTSQILKKWKAEEIALLAEEAKAETSLQQKQSKPGMPGMTPGMKGIPSGMQGIPGMPYNANINTKTTRSQKTIEQTIEEIKYGILSVRQTASQSLPYYSQQDIQKNLQSLINLFAQEKNLEIRRNIIIAIGMANTQDAGNFLLDFLNKPDESFSLKIVALQSIGNITNSPDLSEKLKDILNSLVNDWQTRIENASSEISNDEQTISSLQDNRKTINTEMKKLRKTINKENKKLGRQGMMGMFRPGGFRNNNMFNGSQNTNNTTLTSSEIKTIKSDLKKNHDSLREKYKELRKIAYKENKLNENIAKDSAIVSFNFATLQSNVPAVSSVMPQQIGQNMPAGMPQGMPGGFGNFGMPQMQQPQISVSLSNSFKAHAIRVQTFAFMLIEVLGKLGNTNCLNAVQNAWSVFANNSFLIHYYLAEAQLGDYNHINALVRRLKENYPAGGTQLSDEILLRQGIVKILGKYLVSNPNKNYSGLLQYISQSDPYKGVRHAALQVLLTLK